MATGSTLEITTKITSQIICETIVSVQGFPWQGVMLQDEAHHQENIVVQEANENFIEIDLADNRNVLTILWGTA